MKRRYIIFLISVVIIALFLAGCANGKESKTYIREDVLSMNSFSPNEKNVKFLGRTEMSGDSLWLAFSGSGAEFKFKGTSASIVFCGDDNIDSEDFDSLPRIAVYVNDKLAADKVLSDKKTTVDVFTSEEAKDCVVRVVKLSETGNSTCAIESINVCAYGKINPTEDKLHSIEFIGDSITCGYGVDSDLNHSFSTHTEDCTKAFAYRTAQILDCDYSLVSKSGHGIISGYSGDGTKQTWGIMPDYYESFGSGSGSFNGKSPDSVKWDFKKHSYDIVVINLGTNDASYTGADEKKREEYTQGYISFIKRIRKLNPNSKIVCALGIMGDDLYKTIESAAKSYTDETKDENIVCYHFDQQDGADGYGADWHPSSATHEKAAEKFAEFLKDVMDW